jgi:pantothenate kinase type III
VAVSKTVEFLGGVIPPEVQTSTLNLEKELEKLKKIL